MKVLVLGATGDMGRRTALDLGQAPDVDVVTITGRSEEKLRPLAQRIGGKAKAVTLDINNRDKLVQLMRDHDVVAGAVGPYYLYEVPLARAAIEAGVPYASICDDHDAAQSVLALDETARRAGVTVLSGIGWTPGITNLLVKQGVAQLDEAKEAHIAWAASVSDSEGAGAGLHLLHVLSGPVPTYTNGAWTQVQAGTGKLAVDFGPPVGKATVYHVGHPEPITIPRFIPELETVTLRGGLLEGYINRLALFLARSPLARTHRRREAVISVYSKSTTVLKALRLLKQPISGAYVEVRGYKDGKPAVVTYTATGAMADLTGLPLSIATLMLGRRQIARPGVIAPETDGAIDVPYFLNQLAERGIHVRGGEIAAGE